MAKKQNLKRKMEEEDNFTPGRSSYYDSSATSAAAILQFLVQLDQSARVQHVT